MMITEIEVYTNIEDLVEETGKSELGMTCSF